MSEQPRSFSKVLKLSALSLGALWCFTMAYKFARNGIELCMQIKQQIDEEINKLWIDGEA